MVVRSWCISFHYPHSLTFYLCGTSLFHSSSYSDELPVIQTLKVEQETSVFGPKLIGTVAAIAACLAYMLFRHWLANKMNENTGRSSVTATPGDVIARYIDR